MNGPRKHEVRWGADFEGATKETYTIIITRTAQTVKHLPDGRANEPTRIAAETHSRQAGPADPTLAGWLCVAAVSLVLAVRGVFV